MYAEENKSVLLNKTIILLKTQLLRLSPADMGAAGRAKSASPFDNRSVPQVTQRLRRSYGPPTDLRSYSSGKEL